MASSSSYCSSSKRFLLFSVLSMAFLVLIYSDVTHARNLAETNASVMKQNETLASNYNNQKNYYRKDYPACSECYADPVPLPRP